MEAAEGDGAAAIQAGVQEGAAALKGRAICGTKRGRAAADALALATVAGALELKQQLQQRGCCCAACSRPPLPAAAQPGSQI